MTVEEIFTKVISHMSEGIAYHSEMAKAYNFLGLWGFAECQVYHQFKEMKEWNELYHYYATHYFKLISIEDFQLPEIIPPTWYKYSTQSVDAGTKRNAVKDLIRRWIDWERSTKQLYQQMYQELVNINELDAARKLNDCIHDVSTELHDVEKYSIKIETIGYDLITIVEWSDNMYKKYKHKLGW